MENLLHTPALKTAKYAIFFCFFSSITLNGSSASPEARNASTRINEIKKNIQDLQEDINSLRKIGISASKLQEVNDLIIKISALKNKLGISAIEDQIATAQSSLKDAAVTIWVKSIDPKTRVDYIKNMNDALFAIQHNDMILTNLTRIADLRNNLSDKIANNPKNWLQRIRDYGKQIDKLTSTETKQTDQALAQVASAQAQLITIKNSASSLDKDKPYFALQQKLDQLQLNLQEQLTKAPQNINLALKRYRHMLKEFNFMMQILQQPRTIASIEENTIVDFELTNNMQL